MAAKFNEPEPQFGAAGHCSNGKFILLPGFRQSFKDLHRLPQMHHVEVFSPDVAQWTQQSTGGSHPPGVWEYASTIISHRLYTYGGHNGSSFSNTLHELNLTDFSWLQLPAKNPDRGPIPKAGCGMIAVNANTFSIIGGYGLPTTTPHPTFIKNPNSSDGRGWTNELHNYNTVSELWTSPTTTGRGPPPSAYFTFTRVDLTRAVYFGGFSGEIRRIVSDAYILHFQTWHWTAILPGGPSQPWPLGRSSHTAISLFEPDCSPSHPQLAVSGGRSGDNSALRDMWTLNVDEQCWEEITLPPSFRARWRHSGGVVRKSSTIVTAVFFGGIPVKYDKRMYPSFKDLPCMAETTVVDLALDLSKAVAGSVTGWTVTNVKDSKALAITATAILNKCYDEAIKQGYVESRSLTVLLSGAAGSGKTHVKELIFGKPPPAVRRSTGLECPIRAISLLRVDSTDEEWREISDDDQCQMVADAMATNMSQVTDFTKSVKTGDEQHEQEADVLASTTSSTASLPSERDHSISTTSSSEEKPIGAISVHDNSLPDEPTQASPQPSDPAVCSSLVLQRDVVNLMSNTSVPKKVTKADFINFLDTGGQLHFHELLPYFAPTVAVTIFVTKLNERLDQHPLVEYYSEEGKSLGKPYLCPLSHEGILKHSFRAIQSQACQGESQAAGPKLLVVGTHKDKEWRCSESRNDKNEKLNALLATDFKKSLLYRGENIEELIFPVNAKKPGKEDHLVAKQLRSVINTAASSLNRSRTPYSWFLLEIALRRFATSSGRKVLSKEECFRVAESLHISEEGFTAALEHLHRLSVILHYPSCLSKLIFTHPQILMDKLTELVRHSHRLRDNPDSHAATEGKWLEFRDEGRVTVDFLEKFPKHYTSDTFTPFHLLQILKYRLIIAEISEGKYFMPCILPNLSGEAVHEHRVTASSSAAPLVMHFPGGVVPSAVFCSLVASLLASGHWQLLTVLGKPKCVSRNCLTFALPNNAGGQLTLIDTYTQIEIHVDADSRICSMLCPVIFDQVFDSLKVAIDSLGFIGLPSPEVAFLCESQEDHGCKEATTQPDSWWRRLFYKTEPKAGLPPHPAIISVTTGKRYWTCTLARNKVHGECEERHNIWLTDTSSNGPANAPEPLLRLLDNTTSRESGATATAVHPDLPSVQFETINTTSDVVNTLASSGVDSSQSATAIGETTSGSAKEREILNFDNAVSGSNATTGSTPVLTDDCQAITNQSVHPDRSSALIETVSDMTNTLASSASQATTNWEYQTLLKNFPTVIRALAANSLANSLADELRSRNLIGDAVHAKATSYGPDITEEWRVKQLIIAILSKVEYKSQRYQDFIEVLQLDGIREDAEAALTLLPTNPPQRQ